MRRKKLVAKNNLFNSWLLSYFLILLVPVLISCIVYSFALSIIKNETNRANMALLTQLQQTIDGEFKKIEKAGLLFSFNQRVITAIRVKGNFKAADQYNLAKMREDISAYQNTNDFLDYVYIYFRNNGVVADLDHNIGSDYFYSLKSGDIVLDMAEWKELMHKTYDKEYLVFENSKNGLDKRKSIVYLQTLPILGPRNNSATLVQMVNESMLHDIISKVQWVHSGMVLILDSNNRVIVSTKALSPNEYPTYDNFTKAHDIMYAPISRQEHVVSYVSSEINTWKYILLMPTDVFWEKAVYIRKIIYMSLIFCIVLGGVVSFVFTKKNYNPIYKLVQALDSGDAITPDSKYEEYGFIKKAINNALLEKNKIAGILEKKEDDLKNSTLARLLSASNDSFINAREFLSSYGIDIDCNSFMVILFQIDESEFFSAAATVNDKDGENGSDQIDRTGIVKYIMSDIVETIVNKDHVGIMVNMEGMLACLVSLRNKNIDYCKRDILSVLNDASQLIIKEFNICLNISAGNVHQGVKGIGRSYNEALDALEVQALLDKDGLVIYDEISYLNGAYYFPVSIEHKLANFIEAGDYENAYKILEDVFDMSFRDDSFSVEIVKFMIFDIAATFIKISNIKQYEKFMEEAEPYRRLTDCTSVTEMKAEIFFMLELLCDFIKKDVEIRKNTKETDNSLSEKVNAYIEENYSNAGLGVEMIADYYGMTPAYLSRLYKMQVNERLPDRINKVRLEKSKQLLKETENIKNISRLVGFSNSSVFIRTFKKYEGITPGQYKEI